MLEIAQKSDIAENINIWLFAPVITEPELIDLNHRLDFYVPGARKVILLTKERYQESLESPAPVLQFSPSVNVPEILLGLGGRLFNIDYRYNSEDGYEWARLTRFIFGGSDLSNVFDRFLEYASILKSQKLQKAYIFGTGPSLEGAIDRDWSDGYRIVCNTIVRDKKLWDHIKPNFIVAGDSRYHFGFSTFSRSFQKDLLDRLKEGETFFLYPEVFDAIAHHELYEVRERLLPISYGFQKRIDLDLTAEYELPSLGNVLPLLLLPLACSFSNDVYLWGFDGRAPNDKLFWSNSNKHNYPEEMSELMKAHPAFFETYMPKPGTNTYVNNYMGDELDELMKQAENRGFRFTMMHPTWTPTLQKRIKDPNTPLTPPIKP